MAVNTMPPYRLNKRIKVGTIKSIENDASGGYDQQFVTSFEIWAMVQHRSLSLEYQVKNTDFEDSVLVVVRHNEALTTQLKVEMDGIDYEILDISPDSNGFLTYDYLTLKSSEGGIAHEFNGTANDGSSAKG